MSKFLLLKLLLVTGLLSCSDSGDKLRENRITSTIAAGSNGDPEVSTPPVSIAGSFLHCQQPYFRTENNETNLIYDCGLKHDQEYVAIPAHSKVNFQILSKDNQVVLDNIAYAESESGTFLLTVTFGLKGINKIRADIQIPGTNETYQFDYEINAENVKFQLDSTQRWYLQGNGKFPKANKDCGQKFSKLPYNDFSTPTIVVPEGRYQLRIFAPKICSIHKTQTYFELSGSAIADAPIKSEWGNSLKFSPNLKDNLNKLIFDVEIQGGIVSLQARSDSKETFAFSSLQFELINLE